MFYNSFPASSSQRVDQFRHKFCTNRLTARRPAWLTTSHRRAPSGSGGILFSSRSSQCSILLCGLPPQTVKFPAQSSWIPTHVCAGRWRRAVIEACASFARSVERRSIRVCLCFFFFNLIIFFINSVSCELPVTKRMGKRWISSIFYNWCVEISWHWFSRHCALDFDCKQSCSFSNYLPVVIFFLLDEPFHNWLFLFFTGELAINDETIQAVSTNHKIEK